MAQRKNHISYADHVDFLLLATATLLVVIAPAAESSLCTVPSPAPKHLDAGKDALPLLASFRLSAGYFFGGEDIHFARDDSDSGSLLHVPRTLSLFPIHVDHTSDSTLIHVAGTLTLSGARGHHAAAAHRRGNDIGRGVHSVSFHLDGYYYSVTSELCMAGSGAYTTEESSSLEHLPGVLLKLRLPNPPRLSDPFVTGSLQGAGFAAISLVAYAEGDGYQYGERATCPPPFPLLPLQVEPGATFSCAHLNEQLMRLYKLQYGGAPAPLRMQEPRMRVDQVHCAADGAVRLYVAFSSDTNTWVQQFQPRIARFTVKEEAVVAEGHWDSGRNVLCLRACRVVRSESEPASLAVRPQECDMEMSFWFPAVWTVQDRSVVAGVIWNSTHGTEGYVSASSIDFDNHRGNFSDVEYRYTMVEEATKHYSAAASKLNSHIKANRKGSLFPTANYTYHDFHFRFYRDEISSEIGEAHPVSIGSEIVYGDRPAADASFSEGHAAVVGTESLVPISYDIHTQHFGPSMRPGNINFSSLTVDERRIAAEGVYDPRRGVLCMVGCQEIDGSSTDCRMLITVQFESLDAGAGGQGKGVIRSLRDETDRLYFEQIDISLFHMMYAEQVAEAVSRMDMESVLLVVSTTLPCVFTALQILHAKRSPDASAATSITMLVVLALGYAAPLVIRSEALFTSRRKQWVPFQSYVPYELSQVVLRAPTLLAFVLQLRLLQLARTGRTNKQAETWSAAERKALLRVCLPLYLLGGALTIIFHVAYGRAARQDWLAVRIGTEPATLWEDLASSAGLALDVFLLPQVTMNMLCGGRVIRAVSPWFYVGGSVVRAGPHVYDAIRARGYVPSMTPSNVYASSRDDRFGTAWDIVAPCGSALLALLLFLQQRLGASLFLRS